MFSSFWIRRRIFCDPFSFPLFFFYCFFTFSSHNIRRVLLLEKETIENRQRIEIKKKFFQRRWCSIGMLSELMKYGSRETTILFFLFYFMYFLNLGYKCFSFFLAERIERNNNNILYNNNILSVNTTEYVYSFISGQQSWLHRHLANQWQSWLIWLIDLINHWSMKNFVSSSCISCIIWTKMVIEFTLWRYGYISIHWKIDFNFTFFFRSVWIHRASRQFLPIQVCLYKI